MTIQTGYAHVNRTKLYYKIAGEGRPLVFLHAGLVDSRMWDDQFDFFMKHFRVVCFDQRGYGKSDMPEELFYPIDDAISLLDHLGIRDAGLIGLSMGGGVAIDFTLEYPERVNALILSGPSLSGYGYPEGLLKSGLDFYMTGREKGMQAALRVMHNDPFWQHAFPSKKYRAAQKKFFALCEDNSQIFRWEFDNIGVKDPPAFLWLEEIVAPTLIIAAASDLDSTQEVMDLLKTHIRGAEKVVIRHSSHMVNMDHPEEFNQIVLDFLHRKEKNRNRSI